MTLTPDPDHASIAISSMIAAVRIRAPGEVPGRHATKHYFQTRHPIIRSFQPGEDWGWCFEDEEFFEPAPVPMVR